MQRFYSHYQICITIARCSILMQISFPARKEQCFSLRPVPKTSRHHFFLRLQAVLRHQCQLLEEKVRVSHVIKKLISNQKQRYIYNAGSPRGTSPPSLTMRAKARLGPQRPSSRPLRRPSSSSQGRQRGRRLGLRRSRRNSSRAISASIWGQTAAPQARPPLPLRPGRVCCRGCSRWQVRRRKEAPPFWAQCLAPRGLRTTRSAASPCSWLTTRIPIGERERMN